MRSMCGADAGCLATNYQSLLPTPCLAFRVYRAAFFIRNTPLLGPYSRTIPRVLWWS